MSRLIDADAYAAEMKVRQDACKELIDAAINEIDEEKYDRFCGQFTVFVEAKLVLDNMPTVDAVPVVRCGECKKWNRYKDGIKGLCGHSDHVMSTREDFYCADGERRSE